MSFSMRSETTPSGEPLEEENFLVVYGTPEGFFTPVDDDEDVYLFNNNEHYCLKLAVLPTTKEAFIHLAKNIEEGSVESVLLPYRKPFAKALRDAADVLVGSPKPNNVSLSQDAKESKDVAVIDVESGLFTPISGPPSWYIFNGNKKYCVQLLEGLPQTAEDYYEMAEEIENGDVGYLDPQVCKPFAEALRRAALKLKDKSVKTKSEDDEILDDIVFEIVAEEEKSVETEDISSGQLFFEARYHFLEAQALPFSEQTEKLQDIIVLCEQAVEKKKLEQAKESWVTYVNEAYSLDKGNASFAVPFEQKTLGIAGLLNEVDKFSANYYEYMAKYPLFEGRLASVHEKHQQISHLHTALKNEAKGNFDRFFQEVDTFLERVAKEKAYRPHFYSPQKKNTTKEETSEVISTQKLG